MENAVKQVIEACVKSPRADNLLIRTVIFDHKIEEFHGFKLLQDCFPADYDGFLPPGGSTALYDAALNGIEAILEYGKQLAAARYTCNAIAVVITDGLDNESTYTPRKINESLQQVVQDEKLESLITILIGVNSTGQIAAALDKFKIDAGFTQFINLDNANKSTLAKLAQFVSKSISSQSQALGSGQPSASLNF